MDGRELAHIVYSYEGKIRLFFLRHLAQEEDIEDLTQEVVCAIFAGYKHFRRSSSLSTWIYAICRNQLYTFYRRKDRSQKLFSKLSRETPSRDDSLLGLLELSFDRLRPDQRKLYNDYYRFRKSVREVADELGKPEGTVKYLLYELRKDLALILGD